MKGLCIKTSSYYTRDNRLKIGKIYELKGGYNSLSEGYYFSGTALDDCGWARKEMFNINYNILKLIKLL